MSEKILIKKFNNLYIQIITKNKAYISDIKEFFTEYVEGYRFMKSYRCGGWSGKVCLLTSNRCLPYGNLFDLLKYHKKFYKDVDIEVDDNVLDLFSGIKDFELDFNLNILPRPYQLDCIETALKTKRCIFRVSTAGGKSLIISYIIKSLFNHDKIKKSLIIVPTQSLVEQFYKDMIGYGIEENTIGRLYSKIKDIDKPILISTWQSLSKRVDIINDFQCIVLDEVHTAAKGTELKKILTGAKDVEWRFGLTGTLPPNKLDQLQVKGFIGPVIREYGSTELAQQGYITPCNIKLININYNDDYTGEYDKVKDNVFNNLSRMTLIKNIVNESDHNILLLVGKVEKEGKILEKYLKENSINDKEIVFLSGDTQVEEREKWRNECINKKNIVLIATYGIMSVGINIPSLKYVLFASPFKSKIRILQSIGRSLRKFSDKEIATIYDLVDNVIYLKDHGLMRKQYYKSEKFNIEEINTNERKILFT